ncbi:hypothetical protein [Thauera sp. Sel9]|uniref:hypothetical protein n=1 Tax=Thauera sp. Sel9 TaxID=2974299 RepID=UPI0021E19A9D|nr:hypothetical protein [Thauera sp. Sel9]MCV2216410.1 hypothetical protein [Thauera sp. Sel9]
MFPEAWVCVLGIVLYVFGLGMGSLPSFFDGDAEARRFWPATWTAVAALWWAFMGTRMCVTLDRMLALRLPRIGATFRDAVSLHLLFSVGLPMLVMLLWQPQQTGTENSLPSLAAALWLGSTIGLLVISLPLPLAFAPSVLLILNWDGLDEPTIRFAAGCAALLLAGLSWHWHIARRRHVLLASFGAWVEDSTPQLRLIGRLPATPLGERIPAAPAASPAIAENSQAMLARILGQDFQTLRQTYGPRRQVLTWAIFLGGSAALLIYGHFADVERTRSVSGNPVMFVISWFSLAMLVQKPQRALMALRTRLQGQRAELFLAPGLPPQASLEQAVLQQAFLSLREKALLIAIAMPAAMQMSFLLNPWWGLWMAGFAVLSVLLGLYSTWLAWHGQQSGLTWLIAFGILSLGTHGWMLAHPHAPPAWLVLAWAAFLLWALTRFAFARRRLQASR